MHRTAALPLFTTMLDYGRRRSFRYARPRTPTSGDANKAIRGRLSDPSRQRDGAVLEENKNTSSAVSID